MAIRSASTCALIPRSGRRPSCSSRESTTARSRRGRPRCGPTRACSSRSASRSSCDRSTIFAPDADEVAGALASCLAEASDGIGRELGQGQLVGTILEYEAGTLLLQGVGSSALLAVLVGDQGALGKVRYYVREAVPELVKAL